jgi:DNA-binding NarL/FixJ family response regulator
MWPVPAQLPHVDPSSVRLVLVDDHDLFRTGLRTLLEEEGFEVEDASGGEAAVRLCRAFRPQVVVMDMNMPGMSGVEATRRVLDVHPETVVLMLTVAAEDEAVLEAIRVGASGYLLKEAKLAEIVAGIKAAAAGRSPISPRVAGALVASVRDRGRRNGSSPPSMSLTTRERAVLALLVEGYDNSGIAARLFVSPSTVKNHISNLLVKLGVENRVQAVAYAIRHGLDDAHSDR